MLVWLEDTPFIILFDFHLWRVILQCRILSVKLWVYFKDMYVSYEIFCKWKLSEIGWKHHAGLLTGFSVCFMCVFLEISSVNCGWSCISLNFLFIFDCHIPFYDNLISNIYLEFISQVSLCYITFSLVCKECIFCYYFCFNWCVNLLNLHI